MLSNAIVARNLIFIVLLRFIFRRQNYKNPHSSFIEKRGNQYGRFYDAIKQNKNKVKISDEYAIISKKNTTFAAEFKQ